MPSITPYNTKPYTKYWSSYTLPTRKIVTARARACATFPPHSATEEDRGQMQRSLLVHG